MPGGGTGDIGGIPGGGTGGFMPGGEGIGGIFMLPNDASGMLEDAGMSDIASGSAVRLGASNVSGMSGAPNTSGASDVPGISCALETGGASVCADTGD